MMNAGRSAVLAACIALGTSCNFQDASLTVSLRSCSVDSEVTEVEADGTTRWCLRVSSDAGDPADSVEVTLASSSGGFLTGDALSASKTVRLTGYVQEAELIWVPPRQPGSQRFTASVSAAVLADLTVNMLPTPVADVDITIEPATLAAEGATTARVSVAAFTAEGGPVSLGTEIELELADQTTGAFLLHDSLIVGTRDGTTLHVPAGVGPVIVRATARGEGFCRSIAASGSAPTTTCP